MSNMTIARYDGPTVHNDSTPVNLADAQPDPMSVCAQHPKAWSIVQALQNGEDGPEAEVVKGQ